MEKLVEVTGKHTCERGHEMPVRGRIMIRAFHDATYGKVVQIGAVTAARPAGLFEYLDPFVHTCACGAIIDFAQPVKVSLTYQEALHAPALE